jgi:membrane protein implicated in regulation of membrane protease activity
VATALAASLCWLPVIGTAAAVMASVWAWGVAWWMAVAMYLGPKVVLLFAIRTIVRRSVKS